MPKWSRPWIRSIAFALTVVAFSLPVVSVGACGCVTPACAQQPNQEGVEERTRLDAAGKSDVQVFDAELEAASSGWAAVTGGASLQGKSHDTRLGSSNALTQRAQAWFDGRRAPMPAAVIVPLIGLAGAGLFFASSSLASLGRIVLGLAGIGATALVIDASGNRMILEVATFGREIGVTWLGTLRHSPSVGGIGLYLLFLIATLGELVSLLSTRLHGSSQLGEPK